MDRDPLDLIGEVLDGRFRVEELAGEGDLSVVYRGRRLDIDAPVAIKCLDLPETLDPALIEPIVESFREAGRTHERLARGNAQIAQILAQILASGSTVVPRTKALVPYLVREWFEGESLAAELARRRAQGLAGRSVQEAIALLAPAALAVAFAHEQGVFHLSFNPSNLFLARAGEGKTLKVLDFGVGRTLNEVGSDIPVQARLAAGLRVLFPAYAAPEQLDPTLGKLGAWTDVYAIALVMMEVLSDRPVMADKETQARRSLVEPALDERALDERALDERALDERALDERRRPTPKAHRLDLPRNLEIVLTRAVSRVPLRRQRNARDLWNDLTTAARRGASGAIAPSKPVVVGAVPPRRDSPPSAPSVETVPMSFEPASTLAESPRRATPADPFSTQYPPVYAPPSLPPAAGQAPDLPPVIIATDVMPAPAAPAPVPVATSARAPDLYSHSVSVLAPPSPASALVAPVFEDTPAARGVPRAAIVAIASSAGAVLVLVSVVVALATSRRSSEAARLADAPSPSATAAPPPGPAGAAPRQEAPVPSAPVLAAAPDIPSEAVAPPPRVENPPRAQPPLARFPAAAARGSLDARSRDALHCRHGRAWGVGSAVVTFANDGTVRHVTIGPPFTGTPAGECVTEALAGATVPPFRGRPGTVTYRFFVAPK
jgi:serine/threonine protein kinase